jgi:hypothetical protein
MENRKKRSLGLKFLPAALAILCSLATASYASNVAQQPAEPHKPSSQEQAKLSEQADRVLQQMSRITGLPIKSPVNKKIVSREEVRKILIHNLHTDYTPQEIHVQQATLRAFGLISKTFDLKSFLVSFYTEQAAGFYDPPTKTMYIADWIPPEMQGMVLAHELTHALQDQNFNLESYIKAVKNNDDAEAARQAVVEGYATAAMFQSMLGGAPLPNMTGFETVLGPLIRQQMAEFPVFSKAPFFFRLQALFPYIQGAGFVGSGIHRVDWKGLNELFTSPPTSTKAIFQPDVYFSHVSLPEVRLPGTTPLDAVSGLKRLDENTLGELGFDEMVGQFISEDKATADSRNWSPDAALTFFHDYHAILTEKYPQLTPDSRSSSERLVARTSSGEVVMLHTGDEVRWAEGVPSNKTDAMLKWLASL